jgi:integrase
VKSHGEFHSSLAAVFADYVAVKQALGRVFERTRYYLAKLDQFLTSQNAPDLDVATFTAWCSTLKHLKVGEKRKQMRIVYHFCLFRRRSVPSCYVPDPGQFPPLQPRSRPYIFTQNEIIQLLVAAEHLIPNALSPLHSQVARLAVVLLFTTGLRRGELVRLNLRDYDATERILYIHESKFHKSRLLPLSDDAAREMERYLQDRWRPWFPCGIDSPLLLNRHGGLTRYTGPGLAHLMRKLFRMADIHAASGRRPRVHDLRFSFAAHALLRWYQAGIDVQNRLPALSTYMGHSSVESTHYYLRFLDAVAQAASERFEQHCSPFLPSTSSIGGDIQ